MKYNIDGIKKLKQLLKTKMVVKVGILSGHTARTTAPHQDKIDNATLGALMELGSTAQRIPARSWLQMPLQNHFADYFKNADYSKEIINGSIKDFMQSFIGTVSVEVIDDAFLTGGFGQWKRNVDFTIKIKGSGKPLIDTKQLVNAVSSKVAKKS